ncbi:MarR family winged helix-turn-helix transcriptional regulator [Agromyces larvae]|uniref:MarR family transcriptional regulator n=1 Tax=Agromyces larvae TaxID=2929802 RepID=A0ABY4BY57_9MICO|nr:MarR family transcriptional regulator [Agromyces larvae]UOE44059.1 MarR family transcriptional regulator [Agromyces larvae]
MTSNVERLTSLIFTVAFADRAAAMEWVQGSGLTLQQSMALGYIQEHQARGVIARELAEVSRTTPASVTSLLQGLETRGLIVRTPSPDDSRVKLVSVTDQGAALIAGFDEAVAAARERLFSVLDDDEQLALIALLERVAAPVEPVERGGPPDGRSPF